MDKTEGYTFIQMKRLSPGSERCLISKLFGCRKYVLIFCPSPSIGDTQRGASNPCALQTDLFEVHALARAVRPRDEGYAAAVGDVGVVRDETVDGELLMERQVQRIADFETVRSLASAAAILLVILGVNGLGPQGLHSSVAERSPLDWRDRKSSPFHAQTITPRTHARSPGVG